MTRILTHMVLSVWLVCFGFTLSVSAQHRWLVLPLENISDKPVYNWLGEGIAIMLSDLLSVPGIDVVTPDERRAAFTKLSFPDTAILSRASAIRLGQELHVDHLLTGTYRVTGLPGKEQISMTVLLIDVPAGKLAQNTLEAAAPITELVELQAILAWDLLSGQQSPLTVSRQQLISRVRGVTTKAFELYVNGLLAPDPAKSLRLLRLALKELGQPNAEVTFTSPAFALGKLHFEQGQYTEAVPWLSQVKRHELYYPDAQFYLGLCHYYQDLLDRAATIYAELTRLFPTAGVYNNLALVELKRKDFAKALQYLSIAVAANREAVDAPFNIAYAHWLKGDHETAIEKLREVIQRRNRDGEAHYLLAKSYAQLGRQSVANEALAQARQLQPKVVQWERSGRLPPLGRPVRVLDRSLWYWPDTPPSKDAPPPTPLMRWLDHMQRVAERLIAQKHDNEALVLLEALLKQTPDWGRGHFLKSHIHEVQRDYTSAINELRAATFWDPQLVVAYVQLGRLYAMIGDNGRALEHVKKALDLDPHNQDALSLQQTLLRPQRESLRH